MKEIKFIEVKSELFGYGIGTKYKFKGITQTISKMIQGYVPIEMRGTGEIETMSLIFQKEIYRNE